MLKAIIAKIKGLFSILVQMISNPMKKLGPEADKIFQEFVGSEIGKSVLVDLKKVDKENIEKIITLLQTKIVDLTKNAPKLNKKISDYIRRKIISVAK